MSDTAPVPETKEAPPPAATPSVDAKAPPATTEAEGSPEDATKLADLQAQLKAYQDAEETAKKAKLSEAERLKEERRQLDGERFHLALQKGGVPEDLIPHLAVPEKGYEEAAKAAVKAFEKWRASERKRIAEELKAVPVGQPAGAAGTDQTRIGSQTRATAPVMSLMARPSAAGKK